MTVGSSSPTLTADAALACETYFCYLFTPYPHTEHIFSYPGAVPAHLKALAVSTISFFVLYYVVDYLLRKVWKPVFYTKYEDDLSKKLRAALWIVASIHHVIIVLIAIYSLFIMPPQTPPLALLWNPTV